MIRFFRRLYGTKVPTSPFVRDDGQRHVNVVTLGASGHGKTLLTAKLNSFNPIKSGDDVGIAAPATKATTDAIHSEWMTKKLRVSHSDLPGKSSYAKNMITHLAGADAAVLVVSTAEGLLQEAKDQYRILKHLTDEKVVVFPLVNVFPGDGGDDETIELIKSELSDFLQTEEEIRRIVALSVAQTDDVRVLVDAFDAEFAERDESQSTSRPLFWPLENVGSIPSKGTFVAGRVETGVVKRGQDNLEAFFRGRRTKVNIRNCEIFKRPCQDILAGERGGAFVKLKAESALDLKRGGIIYDASSSEKKEEERRDLKIAASWEVSLRPQFNCENEIRISEKNEFVFFHKTLMEGRTHISESVTFSSEAQGDQKVLKMLLRMPILARTEEPFILRTGAFNYFYGRLIQAIQ